MSIIEEIKQKSQEISTDSYSMSIGELVSMYKENELNIHPEFQRFFRWTPEQKSKFVESILLGIPIPSIFVSQNEKGKWEVIDGLQRVSTILQTMGELKDNDGNKLSQLILSKTKYLPSMENLMWNSDDISVELPEEAKLKIKRARIDVNIILNKSDVSAKYELFQRLNTGGSLANDQEIRNCLLIMVNKDFFDWFNQLAKEDVYKNCISLSDRLIDEQYDLELLSRYLVLKKIETEKITRIDDLATFIDEGMLSMASDPRFDKQKEKEIFIKTFSRLSETLNEDSFKKYDSAKGKSLGAFLISVFEIMAFGLGYHFENSAYTVENGKIQSIHQAIFTNPTFLRASGSGVRASTRLASTIIIGRDSFRS